MKVALINNGTKHLGPLHTLLRGHDVTDFTYAQADSVQAFELIVLSGGSIFPVLEHEGKLNAEIALIRNTTTPLIGICYGCELIAHAFGGTLKNLGEEVRGSFPVTVLTDDPMFGSLKEFKAYEAHRWAIATLPPEFRELARSEHGPEVIRHSDRLIWGLQFHPEMMPDELETDKIFSTLVSQLT